MPRLTQKQLEQLRKLQEVKINGVKLTEQEVIYLCWLLKREYSELYQKFNTIHSEISFSRKQAKDEMIMCLRFLSLVERSNKKWIYELSLSQEKANQEKNISVS